jgi:hypothetical protein
VRGNTSHPILNHQGLLYVRKSLHAPSNNSMLHPTTVAAIQAFHHSSPTMANEAATTAAAAMANLLLGPI